MKQPTLELSATPNKAAMMSRRIDLSSLKARPSCSHFAGEAHLSMFDSQASPLPAFVSLRHLSWRFVVFTCRIRLLRLSRCRATSPLHSGLFGCTPFKLSNLLFHLLARFKRHHKLFGNVDSLSSAGIP